MTDTVSGRLAVLGTYRSGSTALAGALDRLGVDMGAPFYEEFYEPDDLSAQLRKWWNEPELTEMMPPAKRMAALSRWIKKREETHHGFVGAKHPLLSFCGNDLLKAWGSSTRLIWSYRSLDQSMASLKRLSWWVGKEEFIQQKIYAACEMFFKNHDHLHIAYEAMLENPEREIRRIMDYLGISPTDEHVKNAILSIKKPNIIPVSDDSEIFAHTHECV